MIRWGILPKERKNLQEKVVFHQFFIKVQTFFNHLSHLPFKPLEPGLVDATGTWSKAKKIHLFSTDSGSGKFSRVLFPFSTDQDMGNRDPSSGSSPAQGKVSPCICCEDCPLRLGSSDSFQVSRSRASLDVRFIHIIFLIPYWLCRQPGFGESLTSSVLTLSWFLTTNWVSQHLFQDFFSQKIL